MDAVKDPTTLVYVAGPFRAPTPWGIEQNIRKAEAMGLEVAQMGAVPIIPHTMYRYFQDSLPDEFWLDATLELLYRCDVLLLLNGWQWSAGSRAERKRALDLGMPIFETTAALAQWLAQGPVKAEVIEE